jgi:hypothetical protein
MYEKIRVRGVCSAFITAFILYFYTSIITLRVAPLIPAGPTCKFPLFYIRLKPKSLICLHSPPPPQWLDSPLGA